MFTSKPNFYLVVVIVYSEKYFSSSPKNDLMPPKCINNLLVEIYIFLPLSGFMTITQRDTTRYLNLCSYHKYKQKNKQHREKSQLKKTQQKMSQLSHFGCISLIKRWKSWLLSHTRSRSINLMIDVYRF